MLRHKPIIHTRKRKCVMSIAICFWTSLFTVALITTLVVGIVEEQIRKHHRNKRTHEHTNARAYEKRVELVSSCARMLVSS